MSAHYKIILQTDFYYFVEIAQAISDLGCGT
jgi:hypothetical protein